VTHLIHDHENRQAQGFPRRGGAGDPGEQGDADGMAGLCAAGRQYGLRDISRLASLAATMGADDAAGTGVGAMDRAQVAARFSKVIRSGRWVAGRRTRLTAHFGALIVNLADAVLPGREITLEIDAFCGKLILTVPAGAHVIDEGGALFAKRAVYGRQDPGDADGPVIRLVGEARFSKVAVHRGNYDPHGQWRHWRQQP